MTKKINFLEPNINQIRQSILDIDDSYNNPWDILAELCQNSVDAIRERKCIEDLKKIKYEKGKLILKINCLEKSISISDNGKGIKKSDLPYLLSPFSTDKRNNPNLIGEKGVGLTFAIFSCNNFYINTRSFDEDGQAAQILYAKNWKNKTDTSKLNLELLEDTKNEVGTEVILKKFPKDFPIFNLTFNQIKYILRTKTAIGNTLNLFSTDINIDITIYYQPENGNEIIEEIPFKYWLLYETLDKNSIVNLNEFITYASNAQITDQQKRRFLMDKLIYSKGEFIHNNNRKIQYQALFVPQGSWYDKISTNNHLCTNENLNDEQWLIDYSYTKFSPGIYTSIKGMPTGIVTTPPEHTGYSGYWRNIFIIFEDRCLNFDIGRKSIHSKQATLLKEYAKKVFNTYINNVAKYISGDITQAPQFIKQEIFDEIKQLPDIKLNNSNIIWKKTPKNQEASVAALFYECIGSGIITDIIPMVSGYKHKYDLYAKWKKGDVVIEFKSSLASIFKDFSDERKMFDEIDCIVCWEITDNDEKEIKQKGLLLEKIQFNPMATDKEFPKATHRLILANVNPIYIIDLKQILID